MAYLNAIIESIERKCNLKIEGYYQPKYQINGVKFLNEIDITISHLLPNVLYLADNQKYGHHEVYGLVLYVNCKNIIRHENSLHIKEDIDLIELYNTIEEPTPSGPIPIFAAPPVVVDFSKAITFAPFSAAAIAAAKPESPAATTTTSVSNCFIFISSIF